MRISAWHGHQRRHETLEMVPLLKQTIFHSIEPEFARKLINIIEAEDRQDSRPPHF